MDKDSWAPILKKIPSCHHCIALDMPGHGETTFLDGVDEPSVEGFVRSIREFLELSNLDKRKSMDFKSLF